MLPDDIAKALADYDAKVASGEIAFDENGFAHYPYSPTDDPMYIHLQTKLASYDVETEWTT